MCIYEETMLVTHSCYRGICGVKERSVETDTDPILVELLAILPCQVSYVLQARLAVDKSQQLFPV